jgi:hypothetical protein
MKISGKCAWFGIIWRGNGSALPLSVAKTTPTSIGMHSVVAGGWFVITLNAMASVYKCLY